MCTSVRPFLTWVLGDTRSGQNIPRGHQLWYRQGNTPPDDNSYIATWHLGVRMDDSLAVEELYSVQIHTMS